MEVKRNVLKYLAVYFRHRVWCPPGRGFGSPIGVGDDEVVVVGDDGCVLVGDDGAESELGMTVEVLIRFPIGVGNDN